MCPSVGAGVESAGEPDMSRGAPSSSGALALIRPSLVSVQFMTCIARVHALVALGDEVLERRVEPPRRARDS